MTYDRYKNSDNPEWTEADFRRAKPTVDVVPKSMLDLLVRSKGRPVKDPVLHKQAVSLRLDREVIAYFKVDGRGWQTRLNQFLLSQIQSADAQAENELMKAMAAQSSHLATAQGVAD